MGLSLKGRYGVRSSDWSILMVKVRLSKFLFIGFTRTSLPPVTLLPIVEGVKLSMSKVF
jgi:hypothetical protein